MYAVEAEDAWLDLIYLGLVRQTWPEPTCRARYRYMMVNHFPLPTGQGHLVLPQEAMASRRKIEDQGRQGILEDLEDLVHPEMVHPVRLEMVLPVNVSSPPLLG